MTLIAAHFDDDLRCSNWDLLEFYFHLFEENNKFIHHVSLGPYWWARGKKNSAQLLNHIMTDTPSIRGRNFAKRMSLAKPTLLEKRNRSLHRLETSIGLNVGLNSDGSMLDAKSVYVTAPNMLQSSFRRWGLLSHQINDLRSHRIIPFSLRLRRYEDCGSATGEMRQCSDSLQTLQSLQKAVCRCTRLLSLPGLERWHK